MLGMILLLVLSVMIFFGLTARFFEKMGVANWVAFLVALAFAIAAVFPPLLVGSTVSFSYAGFFLPLLLGVVTLFALGANSSLARAVVGAFAVAGIVIAARVSLPPIYGYRSAIASVLIVGFAGGIAACIIGQSRLAMLSATLCGIVLGDFIAAMLLRFAMGATGNVLLLGQNGIFDSIVLTAMVGGIALEVTNLIVRAVSRRTAAAAVPIAQPEAAEDNFIKEQDLLMPPLEEDDLFDDYFNDDID